MEEKMSVALETKDNGIRYLVKNDSGEVIWDKVVTREAIENRDSIKVVRLNPRPERRDS